ncbi:MAG: hypothetical protein QM733_24375 [Ilumatobacteraceae bacterium]
MQHSFSFGSWYLPLAAVLGCGPRFSRIDVGADAVEVRMGWSFRARITRRDITSVEPWPQERRRPRSRGVHGWRGSWLVNGSADGLVTIAIDPPAPARVVGVPVKLRELIVSVADPDALASELQPAAG